MAKTHQSEFKFRRTDTIGAVSAEDDLEFIKTCFVETDEYEALKDIADIRQIVLGRTGSGKSALFERLKQEEEERVIVIEPHELALTYVSNSSVIRYFSDLGVNLDPFYKLLWRHVFTVEVLKKHFESYSNSEKGGLWNYLIDMFSSQSQKDKAAKQAVQYLRQWGEQFWLETEYRVREITTKMEEDLSNQLDVELKALLLKGKAKSGSKLTLADKQKIEVVSRGQQVVSKAQVQDLGKVRDLLEGVLSDKQKHYYILIDRLDEDWVEEKLRYRLIMTLLDSVKEISRVSNIKILVAVRRDLIDRVFKFVRSEGAGFQEEKYQSRYLILHWSPSRIIAILDRRIDELVARRYQKGNKVTHGDLLPQQVNKIPIGEYITQRAMRPRDVISFFNKCIEKAEDEHCLSTDMLKRAEGEYSTQRLKALDDEWHADYPGLMDFTEILEKRTSSFSLSQVTDNEIADLCLKSVIDHLDDRGFLRENAKKVSEGLVEEQNFKRTLFMVFYRIGLIGLKLKSYDKVMWVDDESAQGVVPADMEDSVRITVHPTYRRALGIKLR